MKIPGDKIKIGNVNDDILAICREIAARTFIEHGVYVEVEVVYSSSNPISFPMVSEIYFVIGDHRFDTAKELHKALENKAFL
jgi:hypothetical protein